jgi:hypothetical protein
MTYLTVTQFETRHRLVRAEIGRGRQRAAPSSSARAAAAACSGPFAAPRPRSRLP